MIYGQVQGIDQPLSRIVQGTMMIGTADLGATFALLDAALAAGINTFDTAHVYGGGDCERALGKWVAARGVRDKVIVLDKGAHPNPDRSRVTPFDIASDLHDSLARLQFDCIDIYMLHRDDPAVPVGTLVEALNEHRAAGRVRAFGVSNWTHERIEEANGYAYRRGLAPFVASSPHYSLAEMVQVPWAGCVTITGPSQQAARRWYAEKKMPLFAWSSLCRGLFSGRYDRASLAARPAGDTDLVVRCFRSEDNLARLDRIGELAKSKGLSAAQIVLAWLLNNPVNVFPLVGSASPEEVQANAQATEITLSAQEVAWLGPA